MVFDYEADCSYNTKMLLLPYTSNCGECGRNFGRQAVREGLCAAITFPFSSSARIGIIFPFSLQSGPLSALPCPASLSSRFYFSLKNASLPSASCLTSPTCFTTTGRSVVAWPHQGQSQAQSKGKRGSDCQCSHSLRKKFSNRPCFTIRAHS